MVSVAEASSIVFSNLFQPETVRVPLVEAVNRVLAERITADRDFPPFDRVAMDGIALRRDAWQTGQRAFRLESVQAAGEPRKMLREKQQAIEVMTGAPLPDGTDLVIRYEDVRIEDNVAHITSEMAADNAFIHRQAVDVSKDSVLLEPGILLSPAEIALLASVGMYRVKVYAFPMAAIISTGDELVPIEDTPLPHQIRRSNTYALQAAMSTLGWGGAIHHVRDEKAVMMEELKAISQTAQVIILSGGVSKGKFDFVPEVLETLGVKKLFHQVSQRPGKPFWFGVSNKGLTVFALPGNPVSTYMCFYRYVRPWLMKSLGTSYETSHATLARDFSFAPSLTYFLQVKVENEQGKLMAYPEMGGGSGDFANLKNVTGFLELPAHVNTFKAGETFPYIPFR